MAAFGKKNEPREEKPQVIRPKLSDLTDFQKETAIQLAAVLFKRFGYEPAGHMMACKSGYLIPADDDIAKWALEQARKRSPELDHKEIVAKGMHGGASNVA